MRFKLFHLSGRAVQRRLLVAALLAVCLTFILPGIGEAHAILLRSDPAKDAVLAVAPDQVRMWFSEALNPTFSTAAVVNGANQRVDNGNAHVSPTDASEMDVNLQPNLPPAVYVVVWRSDANDDGHILTGSFLYTVARPDGTIPTLSGGTNPGQNVLGGSNLTGQNIGQLDGPTLFNLIMITLVELGAIFWVGAQIWSLFILQPATEEHRELATTNEEAQRRFERHFSLPTLLVLLLANFGVLLGQAINISGGNIEAAFSPTLLAQLASSGRFGDFWLMRMIVIVLALRLALYPLQQHRLHLKTRPRLVNSFILWANLMLGLALFIAIAMSSHAAATSPNIAVYAILVDWLHLVAAALWVGGMMYIATTYLPILRLQSVAERACSLITVLPYYAPWAVTGVIIMAVTGPFSATVHLSSWKQLLTTAYGQALDIKVLLVGALLMTSAIHVGVLRPRLRKEYKKYTYAVARTEYDQVETEPNRMTKLIAQQVKLREGRLVKRTQRLTRVLRWEPVLGVAVLVCVGLMNVFAGSLAPTGVVPQQPTTGTATSFHTTVKTADSKFLITLTVSPNQVGPNVFTVSVADTSTGKPITNLGVSLSTTDMAMDMGTDTVNLQPDGKGHFNAHGDLTMGGNWLIRIQLRTSDDTLHGAIVKLLTSY